MKRNLRKDEFFEKTQEVSRKALDAGREVWLAGLGTVLTVGDEGRKMFDVLVKEGERLQSRQKANVTKSVEKLSNRVKAVGGQVQTGVQDAMAATLHRMDIPTHGDIQTLLSRVEQLSAKVRTLNATR